MIENDSNGSIDLEKAQAAIKADDFHFAVTRLDVNRQDVDKLLEANRRFY